MEVGNLVLSLKKGESVQVGDDIKVTYVRGKKGTVSLAFEAPKDVRILRTELLEKATD